MDKSLSYCDDDQIIHYECVLELITTCKSVRDEEMATDRKFVVKMPVITNAMHIYARNSTYTKLAGTTTSDYFANKGVDERKFAIARHHKNKPHATTTFDEHILRGVIPTNDIFRDIVLVPPYYDESEMEPCNGHTVVIKMGPENVNLCLGEYKLLIALAALVGQSEPVLVDVISLCLVIFKDCEYHIPAPRLIGWGEFDAIGMTAAAFLYYRNSVSEDDKHYNSVGCTLIYTILTIIFSVFTVSVSVYAPVLPGKLIDPYTLNYTFGIITYASALILVIACMMYKCIVLGTSEHELAPGHGYIHDMLIDTVFEDESTHEETNKETLIRFILDEVCNVQRKNWWLVTPDSKVSKHICRGLDTMPSIITPHTRGDRQHAGPWLKCMALMFSMAACITIIEMLPVAVYSKYPCAGLFVVVYMLWTKTDIAKLQTLLVLVPNLCILAWPHGRTLVRGETCACWHFTVVCLLCVAHSQAGLLLWRLTSCGSLARSNSACLVVLWLVLAVSTLVNRHTMQDFGRTFLVYFIHQECYHKRRECMYNVYLQKLVTEHSEPRQSRADAEKSR